MKEIQPLQVDNISYYRPSPYGKARLVDMIMGRPTYVTPQILLKREQNRNRIAGNLSSQVYTETQYRNRKKNEKGARPLGNRFGK